MHMFCTDAALYVAQYLTSLTKTSAKGKCRKINPYSAEKCFTFMPCINHYAIIDLTFKFKLHVLYRTGDPPSESGNVVGESSQRNNSSSKLPLPKVSVVFKLHVHFLVSITYN